MRNISLETSYTKCGGETTSRRNYKYIETCCRPFAFTSCKAFVKNKRSSKLLSLAHFLHDSQTKIFVLLSSKS